METMILRNKELLETVNYFEMNEFIRRPDLKIAFMEGMDYSPFSIHSFKGVYPNVRDDGSVSFSFAYGKLKPKYDKQEYFRKLLKGNITSLYASGREDVSVSLRQELLSAKIKEPSIVAAFGVNTRNKDQALLYYIKGLSASTALTTLQTYAMINATEEGLTHFA